MSFRLDRFPSLGLRSSGFKRIFQLLSRQLRSRRLVLVETGCLRALNWEGDGCSTVLFEDFARRNGCQLISIDNNPAHAAFARRHCPGARVVVGDSIVTLHRLRRRLKRIDFLYLDSCDVDWDNPHLSALHHLNELCAAAPLLQRGSMVFVDDNAAASGKGLYIKNYLHRIGARLVLEDYQIGFVMP